MDAEEEKTHHLVHQWEVLHGRYSGPLKLKQQEGCPRAWLQVPFSDHGVWLGGIRWPKNASSLLALRPQNGGQRLHHLGVEGSCSSLGPSQFWRFWRIHLQESGTHIQYHSEVAHGPSKILDQKNLASKVGRLEPIEFLYLGWSWVLACKRSIANIYALKKSVRDAWRKLSEPYIIKARRSFRRRIEAFIEAWGDHIT